MLWGMQKVTENGWKLTTALHIRRQNVWAHICTHVYTYRRMVDLYFVFVSARVHEGDTAKCVAKASIASSYSFYISVYISFYISSCISISISSRISIYISLCISTSLGK